MNEEFTPENTQSTPPDPTGEPVWPTTPPEGAAFPEAFGGQGQPPSPQGSGPAMPPPGPYPPQSPPPTRSKRPLFIALIVIAALAVTTAIGVYAFRDAILLRTDPEAYLAKAITTTNESMAESVSLLPDFSKFEGVPTLRELTLRLKETPGSLYMETLEDSYLRLATKSDMATRRVMLEASLQTPEFQINDNKLYISEEIIGVDVPALLPSYGMITVDPATFIKDWNSSSYASLLSELPTTVNLPEIIDSFFVSFEAVEQSDLAADEPYGEYEERMDRIIEAFKSASTVVYEGEVSLPTGDSAKDYKHFTRTFPQESAEDFLMDSFDLVMELYREALLSAYPGSEYLYEDMLSEMDYMREELEELEISGDVTCHFYVDKSGRWSRLRIPSLAFSTPSYYDDERYEYAISLDLMLDGEQNPLDDLRVEVGVRDLDYDDETILTFSRKAELVGGVADSTWRFVVDDEYSGGDMVLKYHWDQNAVSGDNFKVSLDYTDEYTGFLLSLAGNLVETESSVVLSDGRMSMEVDDETALVELEYTQKEISASELDLSNFATTHLFDINPLELMAAAQASVYSLM